MAVTASPPSIPSGEHVQLSLPHVGLLPATVASVEAGAIVLVLAVKDSRVHRLAGTEVAIEYKTGRGIQRFGGILQVDTGEQLRVVMQGEAERIQRREWARVDAVLPIAIKGIDEPVGGETQTQPFSSFFSSSVHSTFMMAATSDGPSAGRATAASKRRGSRLTGKSYSTTLAPGAA